MLKIDSHQHFWKFDPVRDSWINDEMAVLKRDFLPQDLEPILNEFGFDGCIAVQADQSEVETNFLLENAEKNDFIKGVVGWVDLNSAGLEDRLVYYSQFDKLKGFRHILQAEQQRDYMLNDSFLNGINLLTKYGYTFDILIFPDQLKYIKAFVSACPGQQFVIDHLAKPYIKTGELDEWKKDIATLAEFENVYCKISGMVTEASWHGWKQTDFIPYMDIVFSSFGSNRVMYGSDWPVLNLAASYTDVMRIVEHYLKNFTETERNLFFGGNAQRFYKINS
ncbi:amidohydrolase family protein [Mucilaginibacter polytrichastri]|uniref:Amidohydrolase-related domain-containing protein n=1 Tax=Mucilaginibacter polytrichastri TaxID=1302689 RepID=A0A1Q5ZXL4_9SPHI|nr:amidohydrolase family protein [Mucilaginibacter polytrichastri]OKS86487.1 hypothetical protein RG47T_1943 [Mucilaginibacter polytrichastri]SFS78855.1 L-fuconolactonase [Mucilaginibacter polytrichastri]